MACPVGYLYGSWVLLMDSTVTCTPSSPSGTIKDRPQEGDFQVKYHSNLLNSVSKVRSVPRNTYFQPPGVSQSATAITYIVSIFHCIHRHTHTHKQTHTREGGERERERTRDQ